MPVQDGEARRHLAWIVAAGGEHDPIGRADELLAEFGSLGAVLAAPPLRLNRAVDGRPHAVRGISRFNAATAHVLRSRIADRPLMSCLPDVVDYLRFDLSFVSHERIRILYLDARNRLIRDEQVSEGTGTRVALAVRSVVGRAAELGAASIILVHNHPSGDPTPSRQDVELTRRIAAEALRHDVTVLDHLIIGGDKVYSFHHAGILA
jgi:DNA repair protein RadC